ncbi:MAG: glycosyltransferase [Blautia sp.]|nr:glycosyltransferase [Blautia sp.]
MRLEEHILVIVTFNRIALLKKCLQAAFSQTTPYSAVVIVDNSSADGTREYLKSFQKDSRIFVLTEEKNVGGAGGFADGVQKAMELGADWITLIDDDAILYDDFLEKIMEGIEKWRDIAEMFAGVPLTRGIRIGHRRRIRKGVVYREYAVPSEEYREPYFTCQIASFCGLVLSSKLVEKIGLPEGGYFIWYDDTEYCLRAQPYSPVVNCNRAMIDHRATMDRGEYQIGWKEYYGIRNRIDMALRHYGKRTAVFIASRKAVRGFLESIRVLRKSGIRECAYVLRLYRRGISDGFHRRLGLRSPYTPA